MDDIHYAGLIEIGEAIARRQISSVEVTRHQLSRAEGLAHLKAYITPTPELALAQAEAADREIAAGHRKGPLHGVPVARWRASSEKARAARRSSSAVVRQWVADSVCLAPQAEQKLAADSRVWPQAWQGRLTAPLPGPLPDGEREIEPLGVDREAGAEGGDAFADGGFDLAVAGLAILAQAVEHVGDHVADLAELGRAEAARGAGGGADADAAGLGRRERIVGDAVLVAGDAGALQCLVGVLAGHAERREVDQREMRVGAARDDCRAAFL
eukprot:gene32523-43451_t